MKVLAVYQAYMDFVVMAQIMMWIRTLVFGFQGVQNSLGAIEAPDESFPL